MYKPKCNAAQSVQRPSVLCRALFTVDAGVQGAQMREGGGKAALFRPLPIRQTPKGLRDWIPIPASPWHNQRKKLSRSRKERRSTLALPQARIDDAGVAHHCSTVFIPQGSM